MNADTVQQAQQLADQVQPIVPAQKANAVSTWLNRVLVVVILAAIPLLYYFGYIGAVWLNRIGIILNFCAGFMVAPELLGIERIKRAETRFETVFSAINQFTDEFIMNTKNTISAIKNLWIGQGSFVTIILLFLTISAIMVIVSFISDKYYTMRVFVWLMLQTIVILCAFAAMNRIRRKVFSIKTTLSDIVYTSIAPLLGKVTIILFVFGYFLYLPLFYVISRSIKFIIQKLEGDERLRSILVWWGIIFFIVGNLLQFISTF